MLQKFRHLHPSFEHLATVNSLDGCAFEDDVVYEIEGDGILGNSQKRRAPAGPQHLKALMNCGGMAAHFEQDIDACSVRGFENARDHVALAGVERFVGAHFLGELSTMCIHLGGKNHGAATSPSHGSGHQTDRSGAGDEHIESRDFPGEHGMDSVTERIENRCIVFWNRWIDFPDIAYGN